MHVRRWIATDMGTKEMKEKKEKSESGGAASRGVKISVLMVGTSTEMSLTSSTTPLTSHLNSQPPAVKLIKALLSSLSSHFTAASN